MEDKDYYELSSSVEVLKVSVEKDIKHISDISQQLKDDLWELKANTKTIHQNEVDIATLIEKATNNTTLLESYKKELEAKMVTKDYLDDKKYKDWRLWLIVIGLSASLALGSFNAYQSYKNGGVNVPSSNQK